MVTILKIKLFSDKITPACKYCENTTASKDMTTIICVKKGSVEENFSCRSFLYAPLKRVPKRLPSLPIYNAHDFEL